MDLLQLIHELERRGADNGLVVTLKYPVKCITLEETEKDSGWCTSFHLTFHLT